MYKEHCECCAPEEEGLRFVSADNLYYYTELMNRFVSDQVKDELNEFIDDISVENDGIVIRFSDGTKKVLSLDACKCAFSDATSDMDHDASSKVAATPKAVAILNNALHGYVDSLSKRIDAISTPKIAANGGLAVGSNGELSVKSSDLIKANGGLAIDNNGDIYVDFTKLPASEIEKVMKTLKVPVWVEAGKYRNWYVDKNHANASDEIDEGRGQSKDKPFKTISACAKYVCDNYNVNAYSVAININEGEYLESLSLGSYSVTTGRISFIPYPDAEVTIKRVASAGYTVAVQQGSYQFRNITLITELDANVTAPSEGGCAMMSQYANVTFDGCKFIYNDVSESDGARFSGYVVVAGTNATADLRGASEISVNSVNYNATVFTASNGGSLAFTGSNASQEAATTTINGTALALLRGWRNSSLTFYVGNTYNHKLVGDLAARKYSLATSTCVYSYPDACDMPNLTEGVEDPSQFAVYFE